MRRKANFSPKYTCKVIRAQRDESCKPSDGDGFSVMGLDVFPSGPDRRALPTVRCPERHSVSQRKKGSRWLQCARGHLLIPCCLLEHYAKRGAQRMPLSRAALRRGRVSFRNGAQILVEIADKSYEWTAWKIPRTGTYARSLKLRKSTRALPLVLFAGYRCAKQRQRYTRKTRLPSDLKGRSPTHTKRIVNPPNPNPPRHPQFFVSLFDMVSTEA